MRRTWLLLVFFLLVAPSVSLASAGNQFNLTGGMDVPDEDAKHPGKSYLGRFQLQSAPKFMRFQTAFTGNYGSNVTVGEFSAGASLYLLAKLIESSPVQPFVGGEGIGAIGRIDNQSLMFGGYGVFTGVDIKFFKKAGITILIEYKATRDVSIRYWIGIFTFKMG